MIEFISLCVCSACLSCLCCLITGGLCIIPATVRLRNKIVEKHLPDRMQWLGNLPPSEVCESDSSSVSDCCPTSRVCSKDFERSSGSKRSEEAPRRRSKECPCVEESRSSRREKKKRRSKSRNNSSPRRWTFCFKLGKPREDISEYNSEPVEDAENGTGEETVEPKSSSQKRSKKSQTRKNSSRIYCAYFKSCSCTNVREPAKKWRRKKYRSAKCPAECNRDKRKSKASRKSKTCPKNCQCKIITQENKTPAPERERESEKKCCKCGARNTRR